MAAGTLGADLAADAAARAAAKLNELADDPVYTTGKSARKWGTVALGGGLVCLLLAAVSKKLDQSYLNDMTNVLGLPPQIPPTQGTAAAPPPNPPPPPDPPQIVYLNNIIGNVNSLGTASAAANVGYLQIALSNLWALAGLVYGVGKGASKPTQTPAPGLGPQLVIAIVQTCELIYQLEGRSTTDPSWNWTNWTNADVYLLAPPGPLAFLTAITAVAQGPFIEEGPANWAALTSELSDVANNQNYKITLNGLAQFLNASQPFDITSQSGGNSWGVLGVVVSDLSAVGAAIAQGAGVVVNDVETFGKDVAAFAGDIGSALALMAKVFLNLPRLTFDGVGFVFWWGVDMVTNAIWLPLVLTGIALLAYSTFALNIYPRIRGRILLNIHARGAALWARIDRRNRSLEKVAVIEAEKPVEAAIETAITPVEVTPTPTPAPPTHPAVLPAGQEPPPVGEAVPAVQPTAEQPPGEATPPPVEPTPTSQIEQMLGEPEASEVVPTPENAPETPPGGPTDVGQTRQEPSEAELEVMEVNRQASLPSDTYRERRRLRDREAAQENIVMLNEVFA